MGRGTVRNQRGAGVIGCTLLALVVGVAIYSGINVMVPRWRHQSFVERMGENIAGGYFAKQPAEVIQRKILTTAMEFDIDLKPEQIKVEVDPGTGNLTMDVSYERTLDLRVWQKTFPFQYRRTIPW